ncbi:SDR family NAD(P)-dependent oxidoreductase [Xanthomonas hortorum]|uniref:SDR family NAD(P)-dependent oxidoreductase n=1 Tax=Xanthomonas hortorum TaxID=56454 RepID=UPI002935BE3C|nr:SDR family oxidoreductase [Xanthomonas hortorum]MDV2453606.1 SDR family oxidoreductase [Xanthomonas hortorum NBC5720]
MTSTTNKLALVTGGGRGLGRSTALALARDDIDVVITYHTQESSARAVAAEVEQLGRKAAVIRLDTADVASFAVFVDGLREILKTTWSRDHIDFLINNAGIGLAAPIAESSEAMFDQLMAVHLKGVFFLTQALLPVINDGGRIVNLSSGLTRFSLPGYAAYAMMKGGIEVFTRYLAKELGPRGICVNTVAPGAIETDFGGGVVRDNAGLNKMIAGQTALGRVGVPDDIGPVIASLLSEGNRWVNAQRIEASGGMFI